eukprot:COSAG01_NODE_2638_length_7292_cov_8.034034_7_plen_67_part_00
MDAEGQEVASAAEPCYGVLVGRVLPRSEAEPWGAASVASFQAAVLTEMYLCKVCSCQEIFRRNGRR